LKEIRSGVQSFAGHFRNYTSLVRTFGLLRRGGLAVLVVFSILYGSLIPFRFDFSKLRSLQLGRSVLGIRDTTPEDVAVNIFVYAAGAGVLFLLSRRRGVMEGIAVVLFCAILSFTAEVMQALIPQRVSSATDFFLNIAGALLGIVGCACLWTFRQRLFQRATRELPQCPLNFWAIGISSALLAYHLVPFDFVTDTEQLHACFRRVQLFEMPAGLADIAQELGAACWFGVVAFLITREASRHGRLPFDSMIEGLQHGLILACLIECLQLFTHSHVPEAMSAVIRASGALLGSWTAAFFVARPRGPQRRLFSASSLFLVAAIQILFLVLTIACMLAKSPGPSLMWRLPFESLWLQPAPAAAASALSTTLMAFILTATLAVALRRAGLPLHRATSCIVVMGFYFVAQLFTAFWANNAFDPTDTLLAAMACGFGLGAEQWFFRFEEQCARSFVDDRETSEGVRQ
jgi:VanZ family protein